MLLALLATCLLLTPAFAADDEEYERIFDGKALEKWDGNPDFWRVEDGAITGQTTAEKPTKGNTFIIYRGGDIADFELKAEYKIVGGNSGIQYRSFEVPDNKWVIGGYQGDIDAGGTYTGALYGERFRGMLAKRGEKTIIGADHKPKIDGSVGDSAEIFSKIKKEDWNEYHITAKGNNFVQRINGVVTCECTDDDTEQRRASGVLALQLHAGPPMKVQFRNIRLKRLKPESTSSSSSQAKKKIVLLAGKKSHNFGAHDHQAGCMLLAKILNESGLPVKAEVYTQGWPQDSSVLNDANTIVIYADGGGGHPFNAHLDELSELTKKGVGIGCIHYGVEIPAGKPGDALLDWTGGYFEANWSVNPHWTANYLHLPKHPITQNVHGFAINDEWYYHMRFRDKMEGVTGILVDLPPDSTLERKDGPHSGNPAVREAIKNKEPQVMCWVRERPDGGRGFGFTGGHVHWNWGNNDFRQLILNAIVWSAGAEVPSTGVPAGTVTVDDLLQNHDEEIPANFDKSKIQAMLDGWNKKEKD